MVFLDVLGQRIFVDDHILYSKKDCYGSTFLEGALVLEVMSDNHLRVKIINRNNKPYTTHIRKNNRVVLAPFPSHKFQNSLGKFYEKL